MSTRPNLTGLLPPHVVDVAARDRKITLPLGIRWIGLVEPFGDSKTGITRLRTCPRISRTAGNALAAFSFGRNVNFRRASARFPGKSHARASKAANRALAPTPLWAMDPDLCPLSLKKCGRPLPIIGVRRALMQCGAMIPFIRPRYSLLVFEQPSGAHVSPSATGVAWSNEVFFQAAATRWIRGLLAQNPCAIGIEAVHTGVDSCGL